MSENLRSLRRDHKDQLIPDAVSEAAKSFYHFRKRQRKKVSLCNGTSCMVAGTQDTLLTECRKVFTEDEIGEVDCVGLCYKNHALMIDNRTVSCATADELQKALDRNIAQEIASPRFVSKKNLLSEEVKDIESFYSLLKKFSDQKERLIEELKKSGLRGRGGAGFPFALKVTACKEEVSPEKYIVCNADEGDPGAFSDKYLLEHRAELVLFGMWATGYAVGANTGYLYVRAEYPEAISLLHTAIEKFNSSDASKIFSFSFKIKEGEGSYVCGEETALLNSIEGLRPEVRIRPPHPTTSGLYGKPTVLSNVETFANIHWILEHGGATFAGIGRGRSTGTKLVCLDGQFKQPGLYEVEMGTPFSDVIFDLGGGFKHEVKAIQIGGPLGGVIPIDYIERLTLDFESFAQHGFLLGHASVIAIPSDYPMIEFARHLFEFTAFESCGKCFPCRLGADQGEKLLNKAQADGVKVDSKVFTSLLDVLELGSLCALGGGLPLPIRNILQHFSGEMEEYFTDTNSKLFEKGCEQ